LSYLFLSWGKRLSVYFGKMSFMQWFSSGGASVFFKLLGFHKFEAGWMEMAGGQGVYGFFSSGASNFEVVKKIRFGGILLFGFFIYFCFFYN
jgi:hypothetical protein